MTPAITRVAQCACGGLTATCVGQPARVSVCHCRDCQRRTGSAFGAQARFTRAQVTLAGPHKTWTRSGDSGGTVRFVFCPTCGTTLCWTPSGMPDAVTVGLGAFAAPGFPDPAWPEPTMSVYDERAHSWAALTGDDVEHWD